LSFGSLLLEICNAENNGEDDTERAHDNVTNGEEVVFASEGVSSGQDETLLAIKATHIIVVPDFHGVVTWGEVVLHSAVKFSEIGQTSGSHPHNEMLISYVDPLGFLPVSSLVFELVFFVTVPSYPCVVNCYI